MATKPKDINWEALNALKTELVAWLEARNLVGPDDDEFTLALKLLAEPKRHGPVVLAVARALYRMEMFRGASSRLSGENIIPKEAKFTEDERKSLALVMDDSDDRKADGAIRGLRWKLARIEALVERVAELQVKRAEAQRMVPDQKAIDAWHELALGFWPAST